MTTPSTATRAAGRPATHVLEVGHGRGVVLLHGVGGDAESLRPVAEAVAAAGLRALAPDLPGYGRSAPWTDGEPAVAGYAAALVRGLRARALGPGNPAVLVGHSLGGMIALEMAATRPDLVSALVLYATSPAFGPVRGEWQRRFLADRLGPLDQGRTLRDLAPGIVSSLVGPCLSPEGRATAEEAVASVPPRAYRDALHALSRFDRRDALPGIAVPTLVLAAEHDTNAPPAMMHRMAEKIPGSRFICLPGVGHLAHLERRELFTKRLLAFLREVTT